MENLSLLNVTCAINLIFIANLFYFKMKKLNNKLKNSN